MLPARTSASASPFSIDHARLIFQMPWGPTPRAHQDEGRFPRALQAYHAIHLGGEATHNAAAPGRGEKKPAADVDPSPVDDGAARRAPEVDVGQPQAAFFTSIGDRCKRRTSLTMVLSFVSRSAACNRTHRNTSRSKKIL